MKIDRHPEPGAPSSSSEAPFDAHGGRPSSGDDIRPDQVLVVIPALNEAGAIEACIRSLAAGDPFMAMVRIVVADGGSTDSTRDVVARLQDDFPELKLIDNPGRLQSAGLNIAVESAADDSHLYLVRCDAHAVYPPGYVRSVADALRSRPEAASVVTPMDSKGTTCFQKAAAWVVDTPAGSGGSAHRGGRKSHWVDHGHHAGFRLDWFRKIGGYDPGFSHNEDAEYDKRLTDAGGRIWLDASIRLDYQMRPTLRSLFRQYWNYGRGRARTVLKHRMKPRVRQLVPAINLVGLIGAAAIAPVLPIALVWPAAYLALLMGMSALGTLSLRSACGLWAGPALAAMHCAWGAGFLLQILKGQRK